MTEVDRKRIRDAVAANPRKMTLQLALDLDVQEVEVIRAFPPDRVTELDVTKWEELITNFRRLGTVRVIVSNGCTTATDHATPSEDIPSPVTRFWPTPPFTSGLANRPAVLRPALAAAISVS